MLQRFKCIYWFLYSAHKSPPHCLSSNTAASFQPTKSAINGIMLKKEILSIGI